jgi:hypothetical protein
VSGSLFGAVACSCRNLFLTWPLLLVIRQMADLICKDAKFRDYSLNFLNKSEKSGEILFGAAMVST